LKKLQEEMKKYMDKNRKKTVKYRVRDKALLSIKNLIWQMRNIETKKLTEKLLKPYKIKKNIVKLELLVLIKIHLVVNMSRIVLYQKQIERQKKILPSLVKIDSKKKYKVKKILNRRDVREKLKNI